MNISLIIISLTIGYAMAAPKRLFKDEPDCGGKPADIFFLLDSSSSIWPNDFDSQKDFLGNLIDIFDISPSRVRVGVASFSYRYRENIALDDYENKEDLQRAIKQIYQIYGGTYTYNALDGLRTRGFNKKTERKDVAKIAIVITDGVSYNGKLTIEAAMKLKDTGVKVFAVGVGSKIDRKELKAIASEPTEEYMFETRGYDLLDTIKTKLAIKACEAAIQDEPQGPTCGAKNPADVMFLANPAELGANNMASVYEFISDVSKDFNTESGNIQVGLESRNCGGKNLSLKAYADKDEMVEAFSDLKVSGISHMLKRLRTHAYKKENGGRMEARKMAVLFVDDKLYNPKHVLNEAMRTKGDDVELFVVAIGDSVVEKELKELCTQSAADHYMKVDSFDELLALKPEFLEKFCPGL